jgi:Subtilase family
MAPRREASTTHQLPHIRIERFRKEGAYSPPPRRIEDRAVPRDNVRHGKALERQLSAAYAHARAVVAARRTLAHERIPGVYLEIAGAQHDTLGDLTWEQKGIRVGALRVDEKDVQKAAVFIPTGAETFLSERLGRYASPVAQGKKASLSDRFDSVESLTAGSITSLWTDSRALPEDRKEGLWWECWTWLDTVSSLRRSAARLNLHISDRHLIFPEVEIIPVFGSIDQLENLVLLSGAVEQLRYASDSPTFFTTTVRREQNRWVDDLRGRISGPRENGPAVCLLDSGIAQAHPLLSMALSTADCLTVDPSWGTTDDEPGGHGTNMAGTILYSDLTYPLADQRTIELDFKLESVKFLPPPGFEPTDPTSYGSITQAAVSTVEINAPDRARVFCMAVTNKDVSGERPTSWSAALDQAASGAMVGDRDDQNAVGPRRLFFVAGGNVPDTSDPDEVSDLDEFPVEDPAQAWNVLTVGGFTEKTTIDPADGYTTWSAVAGAGDLSPYSRISTDWEHSRTPIKPEIVFEAGNKALSPEQNEILSGIDSLSLLTTNRDFTRESLATFWATSPATAQAAGMAGTLSARFPDFWPETIRALMAHSAEWTPAMLNRLYQAKTKKEKIVLARHFGYGVPSLYRALASAQNDLVLLAERTLTPFQRVRKTNGEGRPELKSPSFKQIDYYDLPWPVNSLEELGEKQVALKITLSYFIEPSPNWDASLAPQRYQSFGLRFDLKRAMETEQQFLERVNNLERDGSPRGTAISDQGWTFGSQSIAAGSLHCDVWQGPAVDLAARGKIAIYPIGGWWRDRIRLKRYEAQTRYALTVSITSDEQDVQLYNEVANLISLTPEL